MFTNTFTRKARKALNEFLMTFAFTMPDEDNNVSELSISRASSLAQELGWRALTRGRIDAIASSSFDSWFHVTLNGIPVVLPRYTIMTMRHCVTASADGSIGIAVESAHFDRMLSELKSGAVFLDIGAAAGTMTVPFALVGNGSFRIIAFEPSRRARVNLEATILRNDAKGITVHECALSDELSQAEFMEMQEDEIGTVPYLPETSRILSSAEQIGERVEKTYSVSVKSLDSLADQLDLTSASGIVIKIDVEGFEDRVLRGSIETLKRYMPFLSIDIHHHPGTEVMTDGACREILEPLGYKIERNAHVLFAST